MSEEVEVYPVTKLVTEKDLNNMLNLLRIGRDNTETLLKMTNERQDEYSERVLRLLCSTYNNDIERIEKTLELF